MNILEIVNVLNNKFESISDKYENIIIRDLKNKIDDVWCGISDMDIEEAFKLGNSIDEFNKYFTELELYIEKLLANIENVSEEEIKQAIQWLDNADIIIDKFVSEAYENSRILVIPENTTNIFKKRQELLEKIISLRKSKIGKISNSENENKNENERLQKKKRVIMKNPTEENVLIFDVYTGEKSRDWKKYISKKHNKL